MRFLKGYTSSIVQDLLIKTDNVEFEREIYYSPSNNKTYTADFPQGYEGEFGPGVKAYILNAYYNSKMSHSSIVESLKAYCIAISACTVSRILTDNKEDFHKEKQDIVYAGLSSCAPQQVDDTSARIKGQNAFVHILCNPFFTAFFSRRDKTRLTVLEVLSGKELRFRFNDKAYALMREFKLPETALQLLQEQKLDGDLNRKQVDEMLAQMYPNATKHTTNRKIILEASAISAYQATPNAIKILLTDDAPQFKELTELLGLCWVHEGRHYKKLTPYVILNRDKVVKFVEKFWEYYRKLRAYKALAELERAKIKDELSKEFDTLFSTVTGYTVLDERIRLTKAKRENLLLVLDHPEVPLHNNAAELAARIQARRRDTSFHTMSEKGTKAKDTFMTLIATAKKRSVNVYDYLCDRITKQYKMPSIASLITKACYQHLDTPPPLLP
jgi:hypothetical protein